MDIKVEAGLPSNKTYADFDVMGGKPEDSFPGKFHNSSMSTDAVFSKKNELLGGGVTIPEGGI